jgi:hypothetical protein
MKKRWNGFGKSVGMTSAAVAGVCLSSSVASAWTSSRDADFETEFDVEAGPEVTAAATEVSAPADGQAGETVSSYLDRLVRQAEDVDVMPECLPEKRPASGENAKAAAADAEDAAWQDFMAALIGTAEAQGADARPQSAPAEEPTTSDAQPTTSDAEPAASVSLNNAASIDEACCPAEEAVRNVAAAVRPVLEFVPFRWLTEHPIEIKASSPVAPQTAGGPRLSFFP